MTRGIVKNMLGTDNHKFGKVFYVIILGILIIFAIDFFFLSFVITPTFFIKYSPDGILKPSTISKINHLKMSVIILALIFLTVAIIVSLFRERTKNLLERKKQTIINVSLLIAVLIFFFLSGEIILRILLKDETSLYGFGPASLKFNQKYVSLNNDGMRDRNFPIEKLKNTIRIAAIGDSFTFGAGIKNVNDTYPKVLDRELNLLNRSNKYEVMNFGIDRKSVV